MPRDHRPRHESSGNNRSAPYSATEGSSRHRRSREHERARQHRKSRGPPRFNPNAETVDPADTRVLNNPYYHYRMRSGKYRNKTLCTVNKFDPSYLQWMKHTYYGSLDRHHIIRKALKQWEEQTGSFAFPPLAEAPGRFKNSRGQGCIYMSERFLRKWGVTGDELEEAGAKCYVSQTSKTKSRKFALFHIYEYVKAKGGMGRTEIEDIARRELDRIGRSRENYATYLDGGFAGSGDYDMDFDYPPWF